MPRFFYDVDDGSAQFTDSEGTEHPTSQVAMNEAIDVLLSMARDRLPDGLHRELAATMRDERGAALFEAKLSFSGHWLTK